MTGPASATGAFRRPTSVRPLPDRTVRIGRAADNDVVVDDLVVSRHHAELRVHPDGTHWIHDLGSHNGTFLDGRPVAEAPVGPEDIVGIGHRAYRVAGGGSSSTPTPARSRSTCRGSPSPSTAAAGPSSTR